MTNIRVRRCYSVRNQLREGNVPRMEQHLLTTMPERLRWTEADLNVFLDMEINELEITHPTSRKWVLTSCVRIFCHSKNATADYATKADRFRLGRKVVTIMCDSGVRGAGWHEFIQLAVNLFVHNYNVLLIEPCVEYKQDFQRWYTIAPPVLCSIWDFFRIDRTSIISHGHSAAVFLRLMTLAPAVLQQAHILLNPRLPEDCEMPDEKLLEATLAQNLIQMWVLDIPLREEGKKEVIPIDLLIADKAGGLKNLRVASTVLESVQRSLQQKAENNPLRSRTYDEVLITDFISLKDFSVDIHETMHIFIFSDFLLNSWNEYLGDPPYTMQTELLPDNHEHPGLVSRGAVRIGESVELPALLNLRLSKNLVMNTAAELKQLREEKRATAHNAIVEFLEKQTLSMSEVDVQSKCSVDHLQSIQISQSRERRKRSSTSGSRDFSARGATASASSAETHSRHTTTPMDSGQSELDQRWRLLSSTVNVVVQRTLETEVTPDTMEDEAVLFRIAAEDSQASYEEDVRKREAKALARSKVDEALPKETEDELVQTAAHESLKDKRRQQLRLNESKQLEAILELSKSDF